MQLGGTSTSNLVVETRKPSKVKCILGILLFIFFIMAIVFIALYVSEKNNDDNDKARVGRNSSQGTGGESCEDASCVISAGDILQNMDTSVKPCDDFYQYSCGGFVKKNYIPDDGNGLNSFSFVGNEVENQLRRFLDDFDLKKNYSKFPNSAVSKAFNFYGSCMNVSHIENAGQAPVRKLIHTYGSSPMLNASWNETNWNLEQTLGRVLGNLRIGVFLSLDISPSLFDNSYHILTIGSGVSGLGEKLSRPVDLAQQQRIIAGYKKFVQTVFSLLGVGEPRLTNNTNKLLILEAHFLGLKDNLIEEAAKKGYDKVIKEMTLAELNNYTDYKFNWTTYINEALSVAGKSIDQDQKLLVGLPNNVKKIVNLLSTTSKSELANEIMWNIIKGMITAMPKEFREAESEFSAVASGIETPIPRWKTCGRSTNTNFEYATALLYAERYLSEEARKRATSLFIEIRSQFIQGLEEQKWMDDATRDQARIKLNAMQESTGYPAFIKDKTKLDKMYDTLSPDPHDLFENELKIRKDGVLKRINQLEKQPDKSRFPQPPVGVNAFYDPQSNRITVLTGMLMEPFYGSERLKALNYGSLGAVVGHEITHGFDVSGSQFDENGNLRSWWTSKSFSNYQQRSQCMARQYNNTYVYGRKLDGQKTLGENIADNGGLKFSYRAYKKWREINGVEDKLPGLQFTNDQLFFISYAQTWCAKYREQHVTSLLKQDSHALNPARVRVPLSNFPEFSKAFNCEEPKQTCTVW